MYWLSKTNTKLPTICKKSKRKKHAYTQTYRKNYTVCTNKEICHITYVLTYLVVINYLNYDQKYPYYM